MTSSDYEYERILRKTRGLLDIKIKVSIRDFECLSMVYTPGVATPCLEIQKDLTRAYEFTNKGNAILILTDSSAVNKAKVPNDKWNNEAAMPYLEGFSALYKTFANIDAYPIILDCNLIPDAETLLDTVNAISPSYHGIELFMIDEDRMNKFNALMEASTFKGKYAYVDSSKKREWDEVLKTKSPCITSHALLSAIWRAVLDTHAAMNVNKCVDHILDLIKNDKLVLDEHFFTDFDKILSAAVDYIIDNKLEDRTLDKYNWKGQALSREYVLNKFNAFRYYGNKAWVEDIPKGYFFHQHSNPENANVLHIRNRGVVEIGLKLDIKGPCILNKLISWDNMDKISQIIVKNKDEVFNLTCKNNYGAIVTNGTAILGLGNIGALAGMPVMEGKSVLFKYFGGTNIAPLCIQELDDEKLINYTRRVAPSFCIINLEDIKGPNCFTIENKLIETVDCPMFHDDQHGTAVVVLAGLINAMKLRGSKPEEVKIVMNGAGAAGISVCRLLMHYGFKNFIVCDTAGAIYKGRPNNMNKFKEIIADETNKDLVQGKLADVIAGADVVIGLSGPNTISKDNVKAMAPKPIVFALANPIPEIYPNDAYEAGAFIVATGRSDFPNQINNSVAFPGIFRGTIDSRAPQITLEMKIAAAKAIADLVPEKNLRTDFIMPSSLDVNTSIHVATEVAKVVVEKKLTKKDNIDIDKVRENIHSFFIDQNLKDVEK